MRSTISTTTFLAVLGAASFALAAPPTDKPDKPDKPGGNGGNAGNGGKGDVGLDNFDPEIVYLRRKNGSYELRLTDRYQTAEVAMNNVGQVRGLTISSEAARTVAFTTDTGFYTQSWETAPFKLNEPELLFALPQLIFGMDFSNDDNEIIYVLPSSDNEGQILVYDLLNRDPANNPRIVLSGWKVYAVLASPVDDGIFFRGGQNDAEDGIYHFVPGQTLPIRRVSKDGNYSGENWDVTRPSGLGDPLLVTDDGATTVFFRPDGTKVSRDFPGKGFNYHFGCSNTELLYFQTVNKSGISFAAFGGDIEPANISWADSRVMDWMERDPCD